MTHQDAVNAWKTLNAYCKNTYGCVNCVLYDGKQCLFDRCGVIADEPFIEIIEKRCAELENKNA